MCSVRIASDGKSNLAGPEKAMTHEMTLIYTRTRGRELIRGFLAANHRLLKVREENPRKPPIQSLHSRCHFLPL